MDLSIVLLVLVVVIVAALGAWWFVQQQRARKVREHFGPEYERTVHEVGSERQAVNELAERERRVHSLELHPLDANAKARFVERWQTVQARFVDDPAKAIATADALIGEAMSARGYPMTDFDQRAADISVEHPDVVNDYRAAHRVASSRDASTEDRRQAMVHYRSLFAGIVGADGEVRQHRAEQTANPTPEHAQKQQQQQQHKPEPVRDQDQKQKQEKEHEEEQEHEQEVRR